ncbi:MAG TPA: AAA family ATPase [Anaerolineales bacterium]|nr:AAA family ATPase [Anaerolineales bacterium]
MAVPAPPPEPQAGPATTAGSGDSISIAGNVINSTIIIKSVVRDDQVTDLESLPPEPGDPPYKGLQYFDEADAAHFFGREQLTARLVGRLHRSRFLAVVGASGSGKSSLVRAGVIPALRSGAPLADGSLPPLGSPHWSYRVFSPGGHPLDALAAALSQNAALPSQVMGLRDEFLAEPRSLAVAVQSLLASEAAPHLLLVVDQFEELFTLAHTDAEREAFINALLAVSGSDDSQPITVMVCLRADFYAQVAQHDRLRELVSQYQEFIGAMSRGELVDAIVGPLAKDSWKIQEGLVKVILDDVGFEPGSLPLLSHALLETWQRRHARTLTLSGYVDCGGVDGAIRETADSVFRDRLRPDQQSVARLIFLRLAELNDDAQDTRRRASFSELITRSTDELTIQAVINILADARLVTTTTLEPGDQKVVEVAHESLIREWPTLRGWLNEDRQGLILHRQLTDAAEDWIKSGQDNSILFRGSRLKQVQDWVAKSDNADTLSLQDAAFLQASQNEARKQARREARVRATQFALVGLAVLLLAVVVFLVHPKPPVMNAPYNVAIADIAQVQPDGTVRAISDGSGTALSQGLASALQHALGDNSSILVWNDRLDLKSRGVQLGALETATPQEQSGAAAALAERLHADMVIYGAIDQRQQPPSLSVQMYLVPRLSDAQGEVQGNFQLNDPIPVAAGLQAPDVRSKIAQQANFLALLALAQSEGGQGHTLEALEYYLKAAQINPDSDLLQFFIGREYLFTVERKPIPPEADSIFEQKALDALQKALQLNPHNARAYIGLGSAYVKQAQPIVDAGNASGLDASGFQKAGAFLDQAAAAYQQALQPGLDSTGYGVPVQDIARLGLGNTYLLRGVALQENNQNEQAQAAFRQAVQQLQHTLPAFQSPELARYLAQNRQFLGSALQWSGYLSELSGDPSAAARAYQDAGQQLNACIDMGKTSSDRIITSDIVQDNCQPMLQQVEQRLKTLAGGS